MTNKEFLIEVQKSCQLDMPLCLSLMGSMQKIMAKAGVDQLPVALPGLGMFTSHKHPEYIQENQITGAMTLYPPRISYRMTCDVIDDAILASTLLAQYASVPKEQASSFVEAFVSTINDHLLSGEEIEVPGIGCFQNIMTHHSEMRHVSYIPSEQMKELVNAPFSCFEPVIISEGTSTSEQLGIKKEESDHIENTAIPGLITQTNAVSEEAVSSALVNEIQEECHGENGVDDAVEESINVSDKDPEDTPAKTDPTNEVVSEEKSKKENVSPMSSKKDVLIDSHDSKNEKSTNWSLYISLSVILAACGFVIWLMFGNSFDYFWNEAEPQDAVVVKSEREPSVSEQSSEVELSVDETIDSDEGLKTVENKSNNTEEKNIVDPKPEQVVESSKNEVLKNEEKVESKKEEKSDKKSDPVPNTTTNKDYHRLLGTDGKPVTVTLKPGERLTLIALEHFGDKAFWPYIFDANADKLKAPNLVQAGMTLYLPDPSYYGIDAKDAKSLQKAKNRGAQLLK